jgi:uncharacterized membrane protein
LKKKETMKMYFFSQGAALGCLLLVLSGCGEKLEPAAAPPLSDGGSCAAGDKGDKKVTFEDQIKPLFATYCLSCHSASLAEAKRQGAPMAINYDSYEAAVKHLDQALEETTAETMPPAGAPKVPADKRQLLECWKQQGHPK